MNKRYAHECPDWDFMKLDEDSAELVGCSCFSDLEFLAIREAHSKELDRLNEMDTSSDTCKSNNLSIHSVNNPKERS